MTTMAAGRGLISAPNDKCRCRHRFLPAPAIQTTSKREDKSAPRQEGRTKTIAGHLAKAWRNGRTAMSVRGICSIGLRLGAFSAVMATALVASGQSSRADDPQFVNTGPYSLVGAIRPFLGDTITSFDISFVDPV